MSTADEDVGVRYRSARLRLGETLATLDARQWDLAVDACPGWRVRDVLAHLVGVIEDAMAGRLTGPPPPAQTREQVDRHRHQEPAALLDEWNALGAGFEDALSSLGIWPAFMDVLSHEHDIRAALGDRSYRDHDDVDLAVFLDALVATGRLPGREQFKSKGIPLFRFRKKGHHQFWRHRSEKPFVLLLLLRFTLALV